VRLLQQQGFAASFREAVTLVDEAVPAPGPGEIRVRHQWCGVNGVFDTQIARNAVDYVTVRLPTGTGVEALGVVDAVGAGVTAFREGDAAISLRFGRGYRTAQVAAAGDFVQMPSLNRDWLALASTGVSAWLALHHVGELREGETVAISAAAGGLGHFLVQLAKCRGARVFAVCGGPDKAAFVKSLGADRAIDHRTEDIAAVLAAECPRGLDVAVDTVSGAVFDAFLEHIAPHGRLVVAGAAADLDGQPEIVTGPRIAHRIYYKGASVRGFMNGLLTAHWPAAREAMFALYTEGRLRVHFDERVFRGLAKVPDAVEHLLSGRSMGKVVADLRDER